MHKYLGAKSILVLSIPEAIAGVKTENERIGNCIERPYKVTKHDGASGQQLVSIGLCMVGIDVARQ